MERGKGKGSRIMAYLRCTTIKGYLPSFGRRPRPYHTGEKIYYSLLTTVLAQSTGRHP